jgi:xylitol oxidase
VITNWAGNVTFSAQELRRPTTIGDVQRIVATADRVRALGSGHSFNTVADTTGQLISLRDLPPLIEVDSDRAQVTVSAGLRYGDIAGRIDEHGFALRNMGSLPHIAVAGAAATGTHGSGDGNQVLATSVAALKLITPAGELVELTRGDADFGGVVLSLGSLGVVTELTLDLVPSYQLRQYVYTGLRIDDAIAHLDEIMASAYSVSLFSLWRDHQVAVWLKSADPRGPEEFFGGRPAERELHPVAGVDPRSTTPQRGVPGPWHERLPHFRLEFTPSNGDELQSEYFVARKDGAEALKILDDLGPRLAPLLLAGEIRSVAADDLWISPASGADRLAVHFTWARDLPAVLPLLDEIEARLEPLGAVPHWGKVFRMGPERLATVHPRLGEFAALVRRYDPDGKLANDFTNRYVRAPFDG